jgi:uncharacterized protein DUF3592
MLENIFAILMALLMIGFGLFCGVNAVNLLYGSAKMWRAAARSKTWPSVDGEMVETTVKHTGRFSWTPIITYKYHVHGVEYAGNRLAFDYFGSYSLREANELVERYEVQTPVKVFYDPEQPQESTLQQTHHDLTSGLVILPLCLFLPTAMCLCAGLMGLADLWKK